MSIGIAGRPGDDTAPVAEVLMALQHALADAWTARLADPLDMVIEVREVGGE